MPSISFQVIDIIARDEVVLREDAETREVIYESDSGSDSDYESKRRKFAAARAATEKKSLEINLFGRTADGKAVRLDVKGFRPSFALRLPIDGSASQYVAALKEYTKKSGVPLDQIGWTLEQKKVFYGFTADRLFPFVVVDTPSMALFRRMKNLFLNEKSQYATRRPLGAPWKKGQVPEVFDASLDPMLRFLHLREIDPCGWVKAVAEEVDDGHYQCDYEDVGAGAAPAGCPIAPFKKIFWDIECMSYTGEFPLAIPNWTRTAKEALAIAGSVAIQDSLLSCFSESPVKGMNAVRWKNRKLNMEKIQAALTAETNVAGFNKITMEYATADKEGRENLVAKLAAGIARILGGIVSLAGDEIIQIGQVVVCGDRVENHLFAYPDCASIDGVVVHSYATEAEMLAGWCQWIATEDPDELIGYNVFGFDERYFHQRMQENNMTDLADYQKLNRLSGDGAEMELDEKRLASSAMGDNYLYTWRTQGRLQIDLLHYVRRTNAGLTSYTLDNVAHHYLSADVGDVSQLEDGSWRIGLKRGIKEAKPGRAVVLIDSLEETVCDKLEVLEVLESGALRVAADPDADWEVVRGAVKCSMGKDDLPPKEIFRHQLGGPEKRAVIGKYCIQDCALTVDLYKKLETFANAMAMANICSVPIAYIFTRGQGIKAESLMFREAWKRGQRIQVQEAPKRGFAAVAVVSEDGEEEEPEDSYEGAIVLTPVPGMYRNVGVCDFASLYPSTMVSENISHDSLVWAKDYDLDGRLVGISWGSEEYDKLDGWRYTDIEFDILKPDPEDKRKNPRKIKTGLRVCRYAQPAGDAKSTVPQVIQMLLAARKAKRKEAEKETDPARAALLDVEQLNYKLTANSLYGQLGSATFKVRLQHCAASITAYGRKQIMFAKAVIERFYGASPGGEGAGAPWKDPRGKATIVYGDTDSLFIGWDLPAGIEKGVPSREKVIELTKEAGELVTQVLKPPHDFEYEKVFDPMLLYTKKRYAGNKYEFDPTKFKLTSMGIATKRRDYAPIVKTIYSGALRRLLDHQDVEGAANFVKETAMDLVEGRISWPQLTITKSLRSDYADPKRIAHKVLADRIAVRDPGNAPASGDRIGYMFIRPSVGQIASKLQGDRIETPAYAREKRLIPDYQAYIENQIAKPVSQMFALVVEQVPGYEEIALRVCGGAAGKRKKEDMDALKEVVARELLFAGALQRLDANEKKNFIAKQFKLSDEQIAAASAASATKPRAKRAVKVALAPEIKKAAKEVVKQGTLMDYMFDKMLLSKPRQKKKTDEEAGDKA